MPAVITCPECDKRFKGKPGLEGKRIRCPACGHGFIVPEGDEDEAPAPVKKTANQQIKAAVPPPASAHGGGEDEEGGQYGVTDLDVAPRCPNCTKKLEPGAIICLFCGYNTQTRTLGVTTKTIEQTGGDRFMHLLPGLATLMCVVFLVISCLYYCLVLPHLLDPEQWYLYMFAHESLKFWMVMISLLLIWGLGMFCFKRLILEPTPPEDIKE